MGEGQPVWYACEFDRSGYAVAARRYVRALHQAGRHVAWQPLVNTHDGRLPAETDPAGAAPPELRDLPRRPDGPAVTLLHCIPQSWQVLREHLGGTRCIGQTVWESDPIPARWHAELAPADELWVPTAWNADVLRRSGIDVPVHVVPHPVDGTVAEPAPVDLPADHFVFTTIATWDWRKRPDLLLRAYLDAFTAADPVTLVLKTGERILSWRCGSRQETFTWWQVMQIVREYPDAASVVLVTEDWTDEQMAGLWDVTDCYVSLTCAEGWGLGAFDAAVAGVPVVITGHGGQLEWLGADHPGLVPYTLTAADHPDGTMFEAGMTWALADVDAAASMLRAAFDGRAEFVDAAPELAARLRREYSSAAIGAVMAELLP